MANLQLIRDLCIQKKISIRELARKVGRDETTIQSAIRRGSTTTDTIEAIASILGVSAGVFFDDYIPPVDAEKMRTEIEQLKTLLNEKERTIQILLDKR